MSLRRLSILVIALSIFALRVGPVQAAPEVPGEPQQKPIALIGGTVHPVSGAAIADATILFDKGRIVAVGKNVPLPPDTERIEIKGQHVYPGLFDAYSNLGLVEVDAVRASVDDREVGSINPNVQAQVAVNPDSELIPVARSNGILLTLTAPRSRLIGGRSAVLQLDGWTWEDLTLQADVGMHVRWPQMAAVSDWWVEKSAKEQLKQRDEELERLRKVFEDARRYHQNRSADAPRDARWEAMGPVLDGKLPLIVDADDQQQIQSAVAFAVEHRVRLVIYGGYDAVLCSALLLKHKVPVIVGGVYRLPERRDDAFDASYTLPRRLLDAKIPFCISGAGRFGASNVRNLPYHAATAVAYGLPREEAIRSMTLSPAEILGVADRVGSLEEGKDATLIVTSGDPLETATQVLRAFVQGRKVELSDRHKRLYRKYEKRYRQLEQSK